jgi:hypothetical protein
MVAQKSDVINVFCTILYRPSCVQYVQYGRVLYLVKTREGAEMDSCFLVACAPLLASCFPTPHHEELKPEASLPMFPIRSARLTLYILLQYYLD